MNQYQIPRALTQAQELIKSTATALSSGAVIPVSEFQHNLSLLDEMLTAIKSGVCELIKCEENQSFTLATARDYALELLFSLDETQAAHKPRTHADNIELIHELLELVDGDEPVANDGNNVVAVNFGGAR